MPYETRMTGTNVLRPSEECWLQEPVINDFAEKRNYSAKEFALHMQKLDSDTSSSLET